MQVARVVFSQCGRHAHLVFSDGGETAEFYFVEDGLDLVNSALLIGKIVEPEADYLRAQIREKLFSRDTTDNIIDQFIESVARGIYEVVGSSPGVYTEENGEKHTLY